MTSFQSIEEIRLRAAELLKKHTIDAEPIEQKIENTHDTRYTKNIRDWEILITPSHNHETPCILDTQNSQISIQHEEHDKRTDNPSPKNEGLSIPSSPENTPSPCESTSTPCESTSQDSESLDTQVTNSHNNTEKTDSLLDDIHTSNSIEPPLIELSLKRSQELNPSSGKETENLSHALVVTPQHFVPSEQHIKRPYQTVSENNIISKKDKTQGKKWYTKIINSAAHLTGTLKQAAGTVIENLATTPMNSNKPPTTTDDKQETQTNTTPPRFTNNSVKDKKEYKQNTKSEKSNDMSHKTSSSCSDIRKSLFTYHNEALHSDNKLCSDSEEGSQVSVSGIEENSTQMPGENHLHLTETDIHATFDTPDDTPEVISHKTDNPQSQDKNIQDIPSLPTKPHPSQENLLTRFSNSVKQLFRRNQKQGTMHPSISTETHPPQSNSHNNTHGYVPCAHHHCHTRHDPTHNNKTSWWERFFTPNKEKISNGNVSNIKKTPVETAPRSFLEKIKNFFAPTKKKTRPLTKLEHMKIFFSLLGISVLFCTLSILMINASILLIEQALVHVIAITIIEISIAIATTYLSGYRNTHNNKNSKMYDITTNILNVGIIFAVSISSYALWLPSMLTVTHCITRAVLLIVTTVTASDISRTLHNRYQQEITLLSKKQNIHLH